MADAVPRMFARMRGSLAGNVSIDWHGHCQWQSLTMGFEYVGFEINRTYYRIASNRIEEETRQQTLF